jgi:dGTPase
VNIRQTIEEREARFLSPRAQLSAKSRGRERPEEESDIRVCFQRDRDRIIHSKAFRRLKHKTQVFLSPEGDHYRTRLTHTLEVSQVARTISRALSLNEDLTEAVALGHDLGHSPFGHTGEDAWQPPYTAHKFEHNEQSVRVAQVLEKDGRGLNLTYEVIDGILCHVEERMPATMEGKVVRLADRVAYINHDIEDALRAGILRESDLPKDLISVLGLTGRGRINNMVLDMIGNSQDQDDIRMSREVYEAMEAMKMFLFENVYVGSQAKTEEAKAAGMLRSLYTYYMDNPAELPAEHGEGGQDDLPTRVIDYLAGMTDRFALKEFARVFMPGAWEG